MTTKEWLTTEEAAARLGVKSETLYAYVSRGIVTRRLAISGKGSEFSRREIEVLATRGSRPNRRGAFDVTIATRVSSIDGDQLSFRGVPVGELAAGATFEQTADLIWDGADGPWPTDGIARPPGLERCLRESDKIRLAVAFSGATSQVRSTTVATSARATARSVITACASAVGDGLPTSIASILAGRNASEAHRRIFDLALLLMVDHEMATSTLAARVAASTRAGIHDVILSGLGALGGPLHGSASGLVHGLFVRSETVGPEAAVEEVLRGGQRLPGLGHKVYKSCDPRTQPIVDRLAEVATPTQLKAVRALTVAMTSRVPMVVNVDFALGAMSYVLGRSPDLAETIFSISRMAGWTAHALEEYDERPLRYRGRALNF